ncbi:MAG: hypothetical protein WAJ88_10570 [Pseudolabrys sp.]
MSAVATAKPVSRSSNLLPRIVAQIEPARRRHDRGVTGIQNQRADPGDHAGTVAGAAARRVCIGQINGMRIAVS